MKLYAELADWYPLLTPLHEYEEESADYIAAFSAALGDAPYRLLELGAGAGHNAHYLAPYTSELALVDLALRRRFAWGPTGTGWRSWPTRPRPAWGLRTTWSGSGRSRSDCG